MSQTYPHPSRTLPVRASVIIPPRRSAFPPQTLFDSGRQQSHRCSLLDIALHLARDCDRVGANAAGDLGALFDRGRPRSGRRLRSVRRCERDRCDDLAGDGDLSGDDGLLRLAGRGAPGALGVMSMLGSGFLLQCGFGGGVMIGDASLTGAVESFQSAMTEILLGGSG